MYTSTNNRSEVWFSLPPRDSLCRVVERPIFFLADCARHFSLFDDGNAPLTARAWRIQLSTFVMFYSCAEVTTKKCIDFLGIWSRFGCKLKLIWSFNHYNVRPKVLICFVDNLNKLIIWIQVMTDDWTICRSLFICFCQNLSKFQPTLSKLQPISTKFQTIST